MRLALALLAALVLTVLVACGSDDEATKATPATLSQQMLKAEDAPGSKADPVEKGGMTVKFDEFIQELGEIADRSGHDRDDRSLQEGRLQRGGYGGAFLRREAHLSPGCLMSSVRSFSLQSDEGATSALDWLEADTRKPCPHSCAVQISDFDVDDIPAARGIHRIATSEAVKRLGNTDDQPFDSYWVGFTNGSSVYTVDLNGTPGSVSEEQALKIASAYYERLAGN